MSSVRTHDFGAHDFDTDCCGLDLGLYSSLEREREQFIIFREQTEWLRKVTSCSWEGGGGGRKCMVESFFYMI